MATGYNRQETLDDCKKMEDFGLNVTVRPLANRFRGLWPFNDPERECSDFIYSNSHYVVARGSTEQESDDSD